VVGAKVGLSCAASGAMGGVDFFHDHRLVSALRLGPRDARGYEAYVEGRVLELGSKAAWWLRERTTVSLAWLSERLAMGHYARVSQAVGKVKREPDRRQKRWQKQLARVGGRAEHPKDLGNVRKL
jgi:hypothetical protein